MICGRGEMKKLTLIAPAKLNLALDIVGLAPNGYHLVDMIMQAVDIYERVEISKSRGFSLRCPGSPVPAGPSNTASKAAKVFFTQLGLLAGADIVLHKRVPTRAGMAGGSADAAAVLVGLNALYGARLSLQELCELGAMVGADVPFSILGGTARASGVGDVLEVLPALPPCWFAVAMPRGAGVSTPVAYSRYDEMGSPVRPNILQACRALQQGDIKALAAEMQNALEHANGDENTVALRKLMDERGAVASMMTGSGAAVFGLFEQEADARAAAEAAQQMASSVFVARPVTTGPQIVEQL